MVGIRNLHCCDNCHVTVACKFRSDVFSQIPQSDLEGEQVTLHIPYYLYSSDYCIESKFPFFHNFALYSTVFGTEFA